MQLSVLEFRFVAHVSFQRWAFQVPVEFIINNLDYFGNLYHLIPKMAEEEDGKEYRWETGYEKTWYTVCL